MRRALPLIGILLLAPLLASSPSSAQDGLGQVAVTLVPDSGSAPQGGHVSSQIRIENNKLHDITVDFWRFDSRDVYIDLGRESVTVEAGRQFAVTANFLVANDAALGPRNVNVRVIERPSGITANETWEVSYRLDVTAAVPPDSNEPARPVVSPATFGERTAYHGQPTYFDVVVKNPTDRSQNFSLITLAPKGWDASGASRRALTYAAGEEKAFNLSITPGLNAGDGPMRVWVVNNANATRSALADAWLRVQSPPKSSGEVTTPVEPTFSITIDPPRAQAAPDSSAQFTVRVSGTRDAQIDLTLENVTNGFQPSLGLRTATVGANSTHQTSLTVGTPSQEGPGRVTIVGRAQDTGEVRSATVEIDVVGTSPRIDLAIAPESQEGAKGDELHYDLTLSSTHPRTVYLVPTNRSAGIEVNVSQGVFELAANETATARAIVRILDNATVDGFFVLRAYSGLAERDAHAVGRIVLVTRNASEPEVELPKPPANETEDEEPPVNETPEEEPPVIADPPPEKPSDNETRLPPPMRIEVDPAEVVIQPGGAAQALVRVTSRANDTLALTFELSLPRGITAAPDAPPSTIAPNVTVEFLLILQADETLVPNATHEGRVRAQNAETGVFTIRIGEPLLPPPTEDDDTATTNSASASTALGMTPVFAGAAASLGAGALGFAYAKRKWPFAFAALYAKLRPSKVLDHEARRKIAEMARAEPGVTMSELQRRLQLANGEIAHHLHVLERARVITSARDGQLRRVYPVEHGRAPRVPDLGERALARDLGVTRQALHYHLKKLYAEKRIEPLPDGTICAVAETAFEPVYGSA